MGGLFGEHILVLNWGLRFSGAVKAFKIFATQIKSRVFFNSVPGKTCKADKDIYKPGTARMVSGYKDMTGENQYKLPIGYFIPW